MPLAQLLHIQKLCVCPKFNQPLTRSDHFQSFRCLFSVGIIERDVPRSFRFQQQISFRRFSDAYFLQEYPIRLPFLSTSYHDLLPHSCSLRPTLMTIFLLASFYAMHIHPSNTMTGPGPSASHRAVNRRRARQRTRGSGLSSAGPEKSLRTRTTRSEDLESPPMSDEFNRKSTLSSA